MCPRRSVCQGAPEGVGVCLFTSPGASPCRGPAPVPTAVLCLSSSQLAGLQRRSRGHLPPQVRVPCHQLGSSQQASPVKGRPLGSVSSARTAPAAVLGHVSGANQMAQLLHSKACVVHPCGKQGSPFWGTSGEEKLSHGGPF